MDAYRLGLQDACFDAVTCGFTFHLLDDPEQAIAEAHRVLRPGGLLAFSDPSAGHAHSGDKITRNLNLTVRSQAIVRGSAS
jgi:ubiquinone/menaquinone biosynthesis C-methylase UbiE